jgi:hypothetical protein
MKRQRIGRRARILIAAILIPVFIFGAVGFYVANQAGALPWQADPTPIPVVPFENLPGSGGSDAFTAPATPEAGG